MATTISEALAIALEHHQAGRLQTAEHIYRQVLQADPHQADALHLLGLLAHQAGRHELAIEYMSSAIRFDGLQAHYHNNLGEAYRALERSAEALACYQRAIELDETYAAAHSNLGLVLREHGRSAEAIVSCQRALDLQPGFAEAHNNLANALRDQGRTVEALAGYRRALELNPNLVAAHYDLGLLLKEIRQPGEAATCIRQALRLRPSFPEAYNDLGNALKDMGLLDEALAAYRRALELRPESATFHSNLFFTLHFHPASTAAALAGEGERWHARHAEPLARLVRPHANDPDPERRLRVGYLSPDLRRHPVGRFLLPLLESHDRRHFEIFCYASVRCPDERTRRLASHADGWRHVARMTDDETADLIRKDGIDVLIDLSAHTDHNRLLVFARKPAPVQVTYLGYCSTTGLRAIDYRLTDPYLDPPAPLSPVLGGEGLGVRGLNSANALPPHPNPSPPSTGERGSRSSLSVGPTTGPDSAALPYTEESVWLPDTYWCYRPVAETPAPGPLPAEAAGHVTFGCLNNFCKATPPALAAWRDLLRAAPASRLLLHAHPGAHRDRVRAFFAEAAVDPGRVEFVGLAPLPEYLRLHERIDIGLDPFPYAGGTTTCDALWMGVPVISLAGQTAVGRAGLSILSNVGLSELVARTPEEYVRVALHLAGDLPRLAGLRAGLRDRLQRSPLMDAPRFARNVEAAFRSLWQRWCAERRRIAGDNLLC